MLKIRLAQTAEEREKIFKLRYQIYVEELGWFESCANYEPNHHKKTVEDPLDSSANLFMALDNNEVVGTLRCNYAKNLDSDYYARLYQMEKAGDVHPLYTSITGRFMVENTFRRRGMGLKMFQASYKQQLLDEIKFNFIDSEAYLVPFFKKLGYQTIGEINYSIYESSTVMVLDLLDIKHLEKVQSPFQSLYRNLSMQLIETGVTES